MTTPRLGFFSRLLEDAPPADRYRFGLEQIQRAEQSGFASAWVAQHHFGAHEGGLPSPLVFLAAAAERTTRIGLGTAVLTLPIEDPVRAAEDAAVLDALSGGRLQLGVASGGTPSSFAAFGKDAGDRAALHAEHLEVFRGTLRGHGVRGTDSVAYPPAGDLADRIWQATFSPSGGARAGAAGDGLLLSRTQPRTPDAPDATIGDIQQPIVDAYLAALPDGGAPRILASRTAFVVDPDQRAHAFALAERGLRAVAAQLIGAYAADLPLDDLIRLSDTHIGTVDEVVASLAADPIIAQATDVTFQVHSVAATHELTLRSIELLGREVAPRLGWATGAGAADDLRDQHRAAARKEYA